MASNRPTGFGLSRELAEKNAAKYSQDDEVRIRINSAKFLHAIDFRMQILKPKLDIFEPIIRQIGHIDAVIVKIY